VKLAGIATCAEAGCVDPLGSKTGFDQLAAVGFLQVDSCALESLSELNGHLGTNLKAAAPDSGANGDVQILRLCSPPVGHSF
jgi:hypothetical protein